MSSDMDPAPCPCGSARVAAEQSSFGRGSRRYAVTCRDCGRRGPLEWGRLKAIGSWNRSIEMYRSVKA